MPINQYHSHWHSQLQQVSCFLRYHGKLGIGCVVARGGFLFVSLKQSL